MAKLILQNVFGRNREIFPLCSSNILKQELPKSPQGRLDCITQVASKVVDLVVLCLTESFKTSRDGDDVSNYMSKALGMALFTWDMEDTLCEGNGERIIGLWKQAGKTKYSLEDLHLLFNVTVTLSEKRFKELT